MILLLILRICGRGQFIGDCFCLLRKVDMAVLVFLCWLSFHKYGCKGSRRVQFQASGEFMFGLGCCFYDICCVVGAQSWVLQIVEFLNVEFFLCNDFMYFPFQVWIFAELVTYQLFLLDSQCFSFVFGRAHVQMRC